MQLSVVFVIHLEILKDEHASSLQLIIFLNKMIPFALFISRWFSRLSWWLRLFEALCGKGVLQEEWECCPMYRRCPSVQLSCVCPFHLRSFFLCGRLGCWQLQRVNHVASLMVSVWFMKKWESYVLIKSVRPVVSETLTLQFSWSLWMREIYVKPCMMVGSA